MRRALVALEHAHANREVRSRGEWIGNIELSAMVGLRFGARLHELKGMGFKWELSTKIPGATHHYKLVGYPDDWEDRRVTGPPQMSMFDPSVRAVGY